MAFALPRVRDDGTLVTLALVNCSIDRQDPVSVRLRGVPAAATAATWHQLEAKNVEHALERRDGDTLVSLPRIGAWACGFLEFKGSTVR